MDQRRALARELAAQARAHGDVTGWFETLYQRSAGEVGAIPWADMRPNPHLVGWPGASADPSHTSEGAGRRALVVGAGLGDDAAHLARLGWQVTAFDIAPTAVEWARGRFPDLDIQWRCADALNPPEEWIGAFDLVVEIYTLQALPPEPRRELLAQMAGWLAPGGQLLIVCRGREPGDPPGEGPWALTRVELEEGLLGLDPSSFEDFQDDEAPPVRRFRAVWKREITSSLS